MAQPGSALVWGTRGRRIEACCPDQHTPARAERSPAYGIAWVAQMVERRFEEPGVRGSIPLPRTKVLQAGPGSGCRVREDVYRRALGEIPTGLLQRKTTATSHPWGGGEGAWSGLAPLTGPGQHGQLATSFPAGV